MRIIGKIFLTLFLLVFFSMGATFCVFLGKTIYKRAVCYSWQKSDCLIESVSVIENAEKHGDTPYKIDLKYSYNHNGIQHQSDKVMIDSRNQYSYSDAVMISSKYKVGNIYNCFVDPHYPDRAILEKQSIWHIFFMLIPLIFLAIGAGGIYGVWFIGEKTEEKRVISDSAVSSKNAGNGVFVIFLIIGISIMIFGFIRPIVGIIDAKLNWQAVECDILSSDIKTNSSSDGTTYAIDILYSYVFNGQEYVSNKYDFMGGSSSGYSSKRKVIEQYPQNSKRICFVNPRNPRIAVLNRGISLLIFILGVFGFVFAVVGFGGIRHFNKDNSIKTSYDPVRNQRKSALRGFNQKNFISRKGPVILTSKLTPMKNFIGILIFTLIWNGIMFFISFVDSGNIFKALISFPIVIFATIGFLLFVPVVYCFLALFNPRAKIEINSTDFILGDKICLKWKFDGNTSNISRLDIFLEAIESATYRRGTDTYTSTEIFYKKSLIETINSFEIKAGSCEILIPENTMHTFVSSNNKVLWFIKLKGQVKNWPDINQEYQVNVGPRKF